MRFLCLAALACLLACDAPPASDVPSTDAHRPADSLLARADLKALVDAQVDRDAAPLIAALAAEDPVVRARAAFALASVQSEAARPALVRALADPDARVRSDAAFALGQLYDDSDATALVARLGEEADPATLALIVEGIGKTGDEAALDALLAADLPASLEAERALAVGAFGRRDLADSSAVAFLLPLLLHDDERVRINAAYYFGRTRDTDAWAWAADDVRIALRQLRPGDFAASHLTLGLGRLADPADVPLFETRLASSPDWRVRVNAARALAQQANRHDAQSALLAALDARGHIAEAAAQALAATDSLTNATRDALLQRLQQPTADWHAEVHLVQVLLRADTTLDPTPWLDRWPETPYAQAAALTALVDANTDAVRPRLIAATADSSSLIAAAALGALASHWRQDSLATAATQRAYFDAFSTAARTTDVAAVYGTADVLADARFRSFGGVDTLLAVYDQLATPEGLEAMQAILDALGASDAPVVPFLRDQAQHPNPTVRRHAAAAYARHTGTTAPEATANTPPTPPIDWAYLASFGRHPVLRFDTEHGPFRLQLDVEQAPQTAQTLLRLAEEGRYDGVPFHRVIPNFVIQGGDFVRSDGFGGSDFTLRSEFTRIPYVTGTAGMASAGKDTEGIQYFVGHSPQPHLDGRYTAFARVLSGQSVVDRIRRGDRVEKVMIMR